MLLRLHFKGGGSLRVRLDLVIITDTSFRIPGRVGGYKYQSNVDEIGFDNISKIEVKRRENDPNNRHAYEPAGCPGMARWLQLQNTDHFLSCEDNTIQVLEIEAEPNNLVEQLLTEDSH